MDIAHVWRRTHTDPADVPRPGVQEAGSDITVTITQECQVSVPLKGFSPDEVTVTVTSHRPGVAAQVNVGANLNTANGSYQGPTTSVGTRQFTGAVSEVRVGFVALPSGFPVLGIGVEVIWSDGAPSSFALNYEEIPCDFWVWWRWVIPFLDTVTRPFAPDLPRGRG
ncbi:MAG TPA: hypothetical protein VF053_14265 [Streptosporangiales bacterium]